MKKLTITIALMLVVALAMPAFGASFSDVPSDHWSYNAINKLVAAGVVEGYPDGEFKGEQSMTRYEMAVMVSRALDNIVDEMDAMGEGLTTGQAEDVTAIVKSLMEKNTQEELTDAQAEEVADIVDALTFELRAELKVLGADVDALGKDVDELAAKVEEMDVPEDNIEFGMDVTTKFEVANYDVANDKELLATMALWADGDALDLDLPVVSAENLRGFLENELGVATADLPDNDALGVEENTDNVDWVKVAELLEEDDNGQVAAILAGLDAGDYNSFDWEDGDALPAEKRFWQEYDFNINGNLGEAKFNLDVDTLTNMFSEEDSAFGYAETDAKDFEMDSALLTVEYAGATMKAGDHADYSVAPYFNDEEDLRGLEVTKNYYDIDWTFLAAGEDDTDGHENDIYGVTAAKDMDFGTVTGKLYQVRKASDQVTALGVSVADVMLTDVITMGGTVAFTDDSAADSDVMVNVNGEFAATDELTVNAMIETVGEDFAAYNGDLEEDNDYDKFNVGAEYVLNENNTVTGAYTFVQIGDAIKAAESYGDEDKSVVELGLENVYGDFTNMVAVEYTMNDEYTDGYETRVIELGTEYAWDETTTLGAALVNKDEDNDGANVINYNYLKGTMDKELADNMTWNTEAKYIMGEVGETEIEGESNSLTTSLTVSF